MLLKPTLWASFTVATFSECAKACRKVTVPMNSPLKLFGEYVRSANWKVVGESFTVDASVKTWLPPSRAVLIAAVYTNGLNTDPGGRLASTRFNWLVE